MPEEKKKTAKKTGTRPRTAPAARRPKTAAAKAVDPKAATGGVRPAAAACRPMRPSAAAGTGALLTIEQTGSGIGCLEAHKRTLRSLGLRHPRQRVVRPDNAAIRGMVVSIAHIARIVEG